MNKYNICLFALVVGVNFTSCKNEPEIPADQFNHRIIDLRGLMIQEFPQEIFAHDTCTQLYIGSKTFKKYPPNSLVPDQAIKLSVIPEDISKLQLLQKLSITSSDITNLPESVSQLMRLKTLDISFNSKLDTAKLFPIIESIPRLDTLIVYRTFLSNVYKERFWITKPQLIIIDEYSDPEYKGLIISK